VSSKTSTIGDQKHYVNTESGKRAADRGREICLTATSKGRFTIGKGDCDAKCILNEEKVGGSAIAKPKKKEFKMRKKPYILTSTRCQRKIHLVSPGALRVPSGRRHLREGMDEEGLETEKRDSRRSAARMA